MLIPAWVEARFRNPQTRSVLDSAWGRALINNSSVEVMPFWTIAPKPPTKSILLFAAALSRALATSMMVLIRWGRGSSSSDTGVMEFDVDVNSHDESTPAFNGDWAVWQANFSGPGYFPAQQTYPIPQSRHWLRPPVFPD
jgi:hypothetical protein